MITPGPFECDQYSDTATSFYASSSSFPDQHIPDCVFELTHLRELIITGQDCCGIEVDANGNKTSYCSVITEIPSSIKNLPDLERVELRINAISTLPKEMAELKKLKVLDLTDNSGITDCEVLSQLVSLEELYLYGCYIDHLPAAIGNLKKLKYLGLARNNFDEAEKARIQKALPDCEISF